MAPPPDWTNATPPQMRGRVLHPRELLARVRYDSAAPDPALAPFVERYWSVSWDLPEQEVLEPSTLDDPAVNLTWERGGARREGAEGPGPWITGPISHGRFDVRLRGRGDVVGVRLAVGGLPAFLGPGRTPRRRDLRELRDRTVPLVDWLEGDVEPPAGAAAAAPILDAWLLSLEPQEPEGWAAFSSAHRLLLDPDVTSSAELQARSGMSARTLQRLFARFVGVGPKRMLLRARVMDAVALLDDGDERPLAEISGELGWFDQSHFVRDFRAVVGVAPSDYASRRSAHGGSVADGA